MPLRKGMCYVVIAFQNKAFDNDFECMKDYNDVVIAFQNKAFDNDTVGITDNITVVIAFQNKAFDNPNFFGCFLN